MDLIYIAGKITGLPHADAYAKFEATERQLCAEGYVTINPMKLPHDHDRTWREYMRECLHALRMCDGCYALNNWQDSRGARIEVWFAKRYGKRIIYQE